METVATLLSRAPSFDEVVDRPLARSDLFEKVGNIGRVQGLHQPVDFGGGQVTDLFTHWIDVVLRQLVILVSFFGAMMATRTGKHINVDALSKLVPPAGRRALAVVTNALAVAVCVVFARAGAELVEIGREHPSPLTSWADEWVFQLMFPFGFGLVAFHFGVRCQ